jgi:5-methyltetrahydrofolate corrinoid/iron sulfur protein methyltransferase
MFIIGERINGMFRDVRRAIQNKDKAYIQKLAQEQVQRGADALDINVGPASTEKVDAMRWLIEAVSEVVDVPLAIDSPNPEVIKEAVSDLKGELIINSTTADDDKLDYLIDLALDKAAKLVALTMDKGGVPKDADARIELAAKIVTRCQEKGFNVEDLFIDAVILPVNVAQEHCPQVLEAIRGIKFLTDPAPKTVLGLSNVSQGTKRRSILNRTFLVMAMTCGLDAAILDPFDQELMLSIKTAEVLLNKRIYCDSYLSI